MVAAEIMIYQLQCRFKLRTAEIENDLATASTSQDLLRLTQAFSFGPVSQEARSPYCREPFIRMIDGKPRGSDAICPLTLPPTTKPQLLPPFPSAPPLCWCAPDDVEILSQASQGLMTT